MIKPISEKKYILGVVWRKAYRYFAGRKQTLKCEGFWIHFMWSLGHCWYSFKIISPYTTKSSSLAFSPGPASYI